MQHSLLQPNRDLSKGCAADRADRLQPNLPCCPGRTSAPPARPRFRLTCDSIPGHQHTSALGRACSSQGRTDCCPAGCRDYAKKYKIKHFYDITDRSDFKANPNYKGVCHIAMAQEGHCLPGASIAQPS